MTDKETELKDLMNKLLEERRAMKRQLRLIKERDIKLYNDTMNEIKKELK